MAKAPKRETENVSREAIVETTMTPPIAKVHTPPPLRVDHNGLVLAVGSDFPAICSNCLSWRPEVGIPFGGCAKSGLTTTHYGETRYVHYTPDGASCSAFEAKE